SSPNASASRPISTSLSTNTHDLTSAGMIPVVMALPLSLLKLISYWMLHPTMAIFGAATIGRG
ncbi:MAG TPA: hypothetical protein VFT30_05780, partial [Nitrospira sp.]|nr:hypothetical protein [Nitrospira sp.]